MVTKIKRLWQDFKAFRKLRAAPDGALYRMIHVSAKHYLNEARTPEAIDKLLTDLCNEIDVQSRAYGVELKWCNFATEDNPYKETGFIAMKRTATKEELLRSPEHQSQV